MIKPSSQPLADRLRPKSLDHFVGQQHLVGPGKPIRQAIESDQIRSMIFWGPPGSGKTTLARVIAETINANFVELSAVSAGKADVKKVIQESQAAVEPNQQSILTQNQPISRSKHTNTVLFLDEIHRFNKAQQDFLLPYVERGTIILIGATTENPSFEVISALLSRCQVYVLTSHTQPDLEQLINQGVQELKVAISDQARTFLAEFANGDARQALNLLEAASQLYATKRKEKNLSLDDLKNTLQSRHLRYDTGGEEHYNTISAFIKSMRASNPDAALYYLARMVDAGEDPLFIARRMVIFASEDIGMAQPTALVVANAVFRACEIIGYPECAINLAHGVVYLATAKKDRRAYDGLRSAQSDVQTHGNLPIPMQLRNAPTKLMKDLGYSQGYDKYTKEDLLPDKLKGRKYFKP